LELIPRDVLVDGTILGVRTRLSRCVADLLLEDAWILLQNRLTQGVLANARGTDKNERLSTHGSAVERMVVLLGINVDVILLQRLNDKTYGLVKENRGDEVVEDLSDLGVFLNVLLVELNQLILAL
jgi:hypothetical protein